MNKPQSYQVGTVSVADLIEAVGAGIRDFRQAPLFGLAVAALYVVAGWTILALLLRFQMLYFAYPLAMGFALIAPFAVVWLYAVSDFISKGRKPAASAVLGAVREASRRDLRWMALITSFALVIWMDIAAFLLFAFVGFEGVGSNFLETILTTHTGLLFLLIGNTAGALIAIAVFSISVVSFPMLYDRDIDFVTAMTTSVRLVAANPRTMLIWCAFIGLAVGLSLLSLFLGFLVVVPVIGHATWHLYKRAIIAAPVPVQMTA